MFEITESDIKQEKKQIIERELKFNGIYKIFIRNESIGNLKINLHCFSYSQENILLLKNEIFVSPSFPFLKSDPTEQEDVNNLKLELNSSSDEHSAITKENESTRSMKFNIIVVRLVESNNLINYIKNQQEFRKNFAKSIHENDIDSINELLQNEILKDLNFYSTIATELKESKKILKEMNELLNELKESNESLFQIRIQKTLEKINSKFKNFNNFSKSILDETNRILNVFEKKKRGIKEISKLLSEENCLEDLKYLKPLKELKEEYFINLKYYKTDDFENEKDIEELTNTTVVLLEEIEQLENENKKRKQMVMLNLERVLLNEHENEIELFLKKNKQDLPPDIYQSAKLVLHNLKHRDEINLQNYLNETINKLNKGKVESSIPHQSVQENHEKKGIEPKKNQKEIDEQTVLNTFLNVENEQHDETEDFEKVNQGETLPNVLIQFHKSVIKLLKLINEQKMRLFIVKPIEPFKIHVENILKCLFYLLNSHRIQGTLFKKSKSIMEIVKNFEKVLVEDFHQLKFFDEIKNDSDKLLKYFTMYSLEKGRFVPFMKEILNEKKLHFTEKSLFFNSTCSDELLLTFDMLNQIRFEFPEFQYDRLNETTSALNTSPSNVPLVGTPSKTPSKTFLKNEKIKVDEDEKEIIKVVSKKKKVKFTKLFLQQVKEMSDKLMDYYLNESKLRPSIEIGKDVFVRDLIEKDIIMNLFVQFFKDGLLEMNYSNWEILSFISENDETLSRIFNKIEEEEDTIKDDEKFKKYFKTIFNSSMVTKFFEIVLNENEIFEEIYEKTSAMLSKNLLTKLIKITTQMDKLSISMSFM